MPNPPLLVGAFWNAAQTRWRLTFDPVIVTIPAVPILTDWIVDPGGAALSPTAINTLGGTLNLINAAWTGAETELVYNRTPGNDYADAVGSSIASFTSPLPV